MQKLYKIFASFVSNIMSIHGCFWVINRPQSCQHNTKMHQLGRLTSYVRSFMTKAASIEKTTDLDNVGHVIAESFRKSENLVVFCLSIPQCFNSVLQVRVNCFGSPSKFFVHNLKNALFEHRQSGSWGGTLSIRTINQADRPHSTLKRANIKTHSEPTKFPSVQRAHQIQAFGRFLFLLMVSISYFPFDCLSA